MADKERRLGILKVAKNFSVDMMAEIFKCLPKGTTIENSYLDQTAYHFDYIIFIVRNERFGLTALGDMPPIISVAVRTSGGEILSSEVFVSIKNDVPIAIEDWMIPEGVKTDETVGTLPETL